ncbi:peptide/nickel transport system permease protein [Stella humosa]|uniref:Peptide/nickel transport system permease protein n=1 Tax=Stella humosa TaxID=94 RepID=A0A3N1MAE0_9PROT|nr:ABC transporter permease [Stella humosa]ROQ00025.1 peptide/nickel transport system permease protein [Stella humosa]BBK30743.1 cytochrome c550 [Stella humosa]
MAEIPAAALDLEANRRARRAAGNRRWRLAGWLIGRSFASMLGLVLVVGIVGLALLGPWIVPYPEHVIGQVNLADKLKPPSWANWFGTDEVGNDILTRIIVGARLSLLVGVGITLAAAAIGVPLGILAGTAGGRTRETIMRFTDLFLSVPGLVLAIALVAALGPGIANAMVALVLVWWPGYVRLAESKALAIREEPYIEAARVVGASRLRILWRHVLPNAISPLIVKMSMDIGQAILAVASLGFIGLGAKPPTPEWGAMISIARGYLPDYWWYAVFPGLFIYLSVLGFNLLGDGLRDILDPRSNRS